MQYIITVYKEDLFIIIMSLQSANTAYPGIHAIHQVAAASHVDLTH